MGTVRMMAAGIGFGALGVLGGVIVLAVSLAVHPFAAIAMLGGIPVLYFFMRYPVWGIALTVAAIPLEGLGRFTASDAAVIVSVAKLFGLMTALALAVNLTLSRARAPWHPEVTCLVIFCLVGLGTNGAIRVTWKTGCRGLSAFSRPGCSSMSSLPPYAASQISG